MSSFVRRAAFALAFLDYNVLGSGAINSDSRDAVGPQRQATGWRSWPRSCPTTAIRTRSRSTAGCTGSSTPTRTTSRYPYAQRDRQRRPADSGQRPRPRRQLRPQQRQGRRRRLRRRRSRSTSYDEQDPIIKAWRGCLRRTCSRPATRCPTELRAAPALPGGPVPRADRHATPSTSSTRRSSSSARAPGRWPRRRASTPASRRRRRRRRRPTPDRPAGAGRPRRRSRRRPASRRTTRCSPTRPATGEDFVILRPFVPFSTTDQRTELQAYMTASSDPDDYGQLTSTSFEKTVVRRPAARGQQRRVDRGDHAADHARRRRRRQRRCASATSSSCRSPTGCSASVRSTRRCPRVGLGQHGHRVPVRDRVLQRSRRPRTHPRGRDWRGCSRASKVRSAIGSTPRPNRRTVRTREPRRPPMTRRTPPPRPPGARTRTARPTPCSCSTRPMHSSTRRTRPWPTAISARTRPRSTRPGRTSPKRCRSSTTDRFTSRGDGVVRRARRGPGGTGSGSGPARPRDARRRPGSVRCRCRSRSPGWRARWRRT